MHPHVDGGDGQKRLKACGNTLLTHHQATIFLLEPGNRPLGLASWHHFFDWATPMLLGLPDPLRHVRPDPALPPLLPERLRILALLCREDLEALARTTPCARADFDRIKQREHLCPLVPIGRRGAVRQGYAAPVGEAVEQAPFAFPSAGDALAATRPRGKTRQQRRQTPSGAARVPRQCQECGPASQPTCHPWASVAASDVWHSSTPSAARAGHHPSDNR